MRRRTFMIGMTAAALAGIGFGAGGPAAAADPQPAGGKWDYKRFPLDQALGSDSAPVTMLEYSSLVCSHCADFHAKTLPKLKQTYIDTGKVQLVSRDFPLGQLGLVAAVFPHCAGKDRYFGLTDVLFQSQQTWGTARDPYDELLKIGRLAGLSKDKVEACMKDQALLNGIESVAKDAEKTYGIDSTPTFIINGRKLVGDQPWEEFQKVIDAALAAAKG